MLISITVIWVLIVLWLLHRRVSYFRSLHWGIMGNEAWYLQLVLKVQDCQQMGESGYGRCLSCFFFKLLSKSEIILKQKSQKEAHTTQTVLCPSFLFNKILVGSVKYWQLSRSTPYFMTSTKYAIEIKNWRCSSLPSLGKKWLPKL